MYSLGDGFSNEETIKSLSILATGGRERKFLRGKTAVTTPLPPDNSNSALSPTKGEIPLLRKFPLALHSYTALPPSI